MIRIRKSEDARNHKKSRYNRDESLSKPIEYPEWKLKCFANQKSTFRGTIWNHQLPHKERGGFLDQGLEEGCQKKKTGGVQNSIIGGRISKRNPVRLFMNRPSNIGLDKCRERRRTHVGGRPCRKQVPHEKKEEEREYKCVWNLGL